MPTAPGEHLFTFAVISDSHVNEDEHRSASPYACNRLANARFRHAVWSLNRQRPAFIVHLGDMANPLPRLPTYAAAADGFHALAAELRAPLYLIPGNHCVGDKPTGWVPVPRVDADALEQYSRVYGEHWYAFRHGPCLFVALDSLLINSGLPAEARQQRWVEKQMAAAAGRRLWLLMHYPPYIAAPDELASYDNVDEPGRSWLLGLLERFEVEAVYTGHVHNYFCNRYAGSALYTVPALSFVRQDYSELFSVAPGDDQGGRDDVAKLGYLLVDVYEHGYRNRLLRTYGETLGEDEPEPRAEPGATAIPAPGSWPGLGVEMRESWLSTVALRTNNSVSPFTRRRARNDWAVLALEEMGLAKVRVPLPELAAADVVERMATLQGAGFEFLVYSHGVPNERTDRLIREHRALFSGWELILDLDELEPAARRIAGIRGRLPGDLPCFLSPLRNVRVAGRDPAGREIDGANVKHEANYGFHASDRELAAELAGGDTVRRTFRGFVFRNRRRGEPSPPPWTAIHEVAELGRAAGLRHQVHLLFSGNLTAESLVDDRDTANRVAEAALAAHLAGDVDLYFDTFEDIDRGYFVRHGLVDRRYNPRLAARVVKHLRTAVAGHDLGELGDWKLSDSAHGRQISTAGRGRFRMLILPRARRTLREIPGTAGGGDSVLWIDLATGEASPVATLAAGSIAGSRMRLRQARTVDGPVLLIGEKRPQKSK